MCSFSFHEQSWHKTDSGNQSKHLYIQKAFVSNIAKIEEAKIRCNQYNFMDIFIVPTIHDKNISYQALMWNDDQHNLFLPWDSVTFDNICLWQYCFKNVARWSSEQRLGSLFLLQVSYHQDSWESWLKVQRSTYVL